MTVVRINMKGLAASVAGAALLALSLPSQPAFAGFEWTPPPQQAKAAAPAAAEAPADPTATGPLTPDPDAAVPVTPVDPAPLQAADLPVPQEQPAPGMKTLSAAPAAPEAAPQPAPAPVKEEVQWNEPAKVAAAPAPAPAAPANAPAGLDMTPVQGFGKDIPLVIALRQVAPAHYAYKFDPGVSPGQKVSWNGGAPWPQVLSDMLTKSDLQVTIVGNTITVQKAGTDASAPAPEQKAEAAPAGAPAEAVAEAAPEAKPAAQDAKEEPAKDDVAAAPAADDLPVPKESDDKPVAKTAYVPGSASAPQSEASAPPVDIQTEAQAAEASEKQAADDAPVAAVANASGAAPVVDIQTSRQWSATPGATLRETLEKWSAAAGTEIEWMSPYDYPVDHAFQYNGKFDEAVDSLLALYSREDHRPRGRLYPNLPTGPSVLMIN